MRLAVIGGLGLMLGPAARHLGSAEGPGRVVRLLDRGKTGPDRDARRADWKQYGARLVTNYAELLVDDEGRPVDGVIVCAGKNGDDREIIRELTRRMKALNTLEPMFILHLSTVSVRFANAAAEYCASQGVDYANYPLTGGPIGAEAATMLILAGGNEALFTRVRPFLERLGKPRFFSENPGSGAETKLIGHYLVFQGLLGLSAAVVLQQAVQPEANSPEFFDYLNQGAGHTRQWEGALRKGIADDQWETGFYARYAAVDLLYALQLGLDSELNMAALLPMFQAALLMALVVQHSDAKDREFATHAVYHEMTGRYKERANHLLLQLLDLKDPRGSLERIARVLPADVLRTVGLEVRGADFFA